ncbi:hypothetical protein HOY82DRAFT_609953 [Tuber indicum]|nr:hypothetical protein HOY82DRAFT_609953 [Tuber indicum]
MGTSWSGFVDRYLTPIATVVGSALVAVITVYCTKPVTPRFKFSGAPFVVTTTIVTTVTDSHPGSTAMADLTRQLEVERGRRESCEARLRRVSETPRRRLVGQSCC